MHIETAWAGLIMIALQGCSHEPTPRPRGHFRIDMPAHRYAPFKSQCGPIAEVASQAIVREKVQDEGECFINVDYPANKATIHLTHSRLHGDLPDRIEDAHAFKSAHQARASSIRTEPFINDSADVHGTMFIVEGEVASPMVFYLTDSTDNFLYGSLYFSARPNADSLAPVTAHIRDDMRHFAATLKWH